MIHLMTLTLRIRHLETSYGKRDCYYIRYCDTEHDGSFFPNCSKKRLAFSSDSDSTSDDQEEDVTIIPAGSERYMYVVVYQIL